MRDKSALTLVIHDVRDVDRVFVFRLGHSSLMTLMTCWNESLSSTENRQSRAHRDSSKIENYFLRCNKSNINQSDNLYAWHASIRCVTWLIPMCDMTCLFIRMCDMSHLYAWHAPWIVTWACVHHGLHLSSGLLRGGTFHWLNNLKRIESVSWETLKERRGHGLQYVVMCRSLLHVKVRCSVA